MTDTIENTIRALVARFNAASEPYAAIMRDDYALATPYASRHFQAAAITLPDVTEKKWQDHNNATAAKRLGLATALLKQTNNLTKHLVVAQVKLSGMPDRSESDLQWVIETARENIDYGSEKAQLVSEIKVGTQFLEATPHMDDAVKQAFDRANTVLLGNDPRELTLHELMIAINTLHTTIASNWLKHAGAFLDMAEVTLGLMATPARPTGDKLTTRKTMTRALLHFSSESLTNGTLHDTRSRRSIPQSFRSSVLN